MPRALAGCHVSPAPVQPARHPPRSPILPARLSARLALATVLSLITYLWYWGQQKKMQYVEDNKILLRELYEESELAPHKATNAAAGATGAGATGGGSLASNGAGGCLASCRLGAGQVGWVGRWAWGSVPGITLLQPASPALALS